MSGQELFVAFCLQLCGFFSYGHCSNHQLARLASYFWNRLSDDYKAQWKMAADGFNAANGLTGKKKRRGFWQFASILRQQMLDWQSALFFDVWKNLKPNESEKWKNPAGSLVNNEIDRIQSEIENLSL